MPLTLRQVVLGGLPLSLVVLSSPSAFADGQYIGAASDWLCEAFSTSKIEHILLEFPMSGEGTLRDLSKRDRKHSALTRHYWDVESQHWFLRHAKNCWDRGKCREYDLEIRAYGADYLFASDADAIAWIERFGPAEVDQDNPGSFIFEYSDHDNNEFSLWVDVPSQVVWIDWDVEVQDVGQRVCEHK